MKWAAVKWAAVMSSAVPVRPTKSTWLSSTIASRPTACRLFSTTNCSTAPPTHAARWRQAKIPLAGKRLADLCTLDAGSWFSGSFAGVPIPTLVEAIRLITPVAIALIERKAGPADRCIDLLRNADAIDRVVVQAFDWNYLADCHRLAPELVLAALGEDELTTDRLDEICRRQFPLVAWDHERLSADLVNQIHARGLRIFAWTVDDPARMRTLAALGVDGIITNCPHLLVAIRREIGGASREALAAATQQEAIPPSGATTAT